MTGTLVLTLGPAITPDDVPVLCERLSTLLRDGGGHAVALDVGVLTAPDVSTLNALARMQLTAGRLGCTLRLRHARAELRALLALTGLDAVLPLAGSGVEHRGQAEQREEALGVEERGEPGDAVS
ncbi:STAS domain-containing protein [Wenjunlia tyrosinilytica]|uniref:STAS domain-containing protein n=1 Tax=Wenjunlia tyrosinilytica TaxID=1544741 RepID=UPI001E6404F3|nr:STAS domain-containing protein [Wenjunlia tyrosinilytica]